MHASQTVRIAGNGNRYLIQRIRDAKIVGFAPSYWQASLICSQNGWTVAW